LSSLASAFCLAFFQQAGQRQHETGAPLPSFVQLSLHPNLELIKVYGVSVSGDAIPQSVHVLPMRHFTASSGELITGGRRRRNAPVNDISTTRRAVSRSKKGGRAFASERTVNRTLFWTFPRLVGPTCKDCGSVAEKRGEGSTLSQSGWRLMWAPGQGRTTAPTWYCPRCWQKRKNEKGRPPAG